MRREDAPEALCVWDVESTGVDITQDRILTAYAMVTNIKGEKLDERSWTIDPGVEVPAGASDVHGMTTEWVRENGRKDVAEAIHDIEWYLEGAVSNGWPIVGFNNSYDLGILHHEMRRHHGHGLRLDRPGYKWDGEFFDPIIYDRAMDKYRRGNRKLMTVAAHYGIEVDESKLHDAEYDVILTSKLAWRLLQKSPYTLAELQPLQLQWKREWAEHLTEYFASQDKTEEDGSPIIVDGSFPWKKE